MINFLTNSTLASYTLLNIAETYLEKLRLTEPLLHVKLTTDKDIEFLFQTIKWAFITVSTLYISTLTVSHHFKIFSKFADRDTIYQLILAVTAVGITALGYLSKKAATLTSRIFSPASAVLPTTNTSIKWSDTPNKKNRLTLSILQTIFNIAMIRFSSLPWVFGANALVTTYTFLNSARQKDLKASYRVNTLRPLHQEGDHSHHFKSYLTCIAPKNPRLEDACAICQDETHPTDAQFCTNNHSYHASCIITWINEKLPRLASNAAITRIHCHATTNGMRDPASDSIKYTIQIPTTALPTCPLCKTHSPLNTIEVSIKDFFKMKYKKIKAEVTLISQPV